MSIEPSADTSATAEPEMPPNSIDEKTLTTPRPPRTQPTADEAKPHQPRGDAAVEHQLTGEDEERDREQREHADAGDDPLERDQQRQALPPERRHGGHTERERNRDADDDQHREQAEQDGKTHRYRSPAAAGAGASPCSMPTRLPSENRHTSAPPTATGTARQPSGMLSSGIIEPHLNTASW